MHILFKYVQFYIKPNSPIINNSSKNHSNSLTIKTEIHSSESVKTYFLVCNINELILLLFC